MPSDPEFHDFIVTAAELADDQRAAIAIDLTDKRGGKVRLHLTLDMAQRLASETARGIKASEAE